MAYFVESEFESTLGTLKVIFHGNSTLFMTYGPSDYGHERTYLTINRVKYHARIDLSLNDGSWGPYRDQNGHDWHFSHLSREDFKDASTTAGAKVRNVLVPELVAYIDAHPELVKEGLAKTKQDEIDRAASKLANAKAELEKATQLLGTSAADIDAVNAAGAFTDPKLEQLRQAILKKNLLWHQHRRPTNWAFAYGNRQQVPSSHDHRPGKPRWFPAEVQAIVALIEKAEDHIHTLAEQISDQSK